MDLTQEDIKKIASLMKSAGYSKLNHESLEDFYFNNVGKCDLCLKLNFTSWCRSMCGQGDISSKIMFIGSSINRNELEAGCLFPKGSIESIYYNRYLDVLGLREVDVFLTDSVLGFANNRDTENLRQVCRLWKKIELYLQKPKIIFLMGTEAFQSFKIRRPFSLEYDDFIEINGQKTRVITLLHPAQGSLKPKMFEQSMSKLLSVKDSLLEYLKDGE